MTGIGWLGIAVVVGCAMFATAASANCVLTGLGSATSLMTCTGGVRGTIIELGNGLASYHFSNGSSGMLHLTTAATGADAVPSPATASGLGATSLPSASASTVSASSQNLSVSSGPTIAFLVSGAGGTPKSGVPLVPGGRAGIATVDSVLHAPLTPRLATIADSSLPSPRAPQPQLAMSANGH